MSRAAELAKLKKADLVALVEKLELDVASTDHRLGATGEAVRALVGELGDLSAQQKLQAAAAAQLARAIDFGPELARAGLVKQLMAIQAELAEGLEEEESDLVDQLAARRLHRADAPSGAPGAADDRVEGAG